MLGAGVTAEQQALVRRGLDLGATYFHGAWARDLPPMTVYVDDDLDGIVNLYATSYPRPIEVSRQIWQTATAIAAPRRTWVFTGAASWLANPEWARIKILAHEAFHVMQYEFAGVHALEAEADQVPAIGPQWLTEGSAEYVAHEAIAAAGLVQMAQVRNGWIARTKTLTTPLRSRETSNGFFADNEGYQISPLAIDFLRSGPLRRPAHDLPRLDRPWRAVDAAFAAAFGKSVDGFYAEFEAYRGTL